MTTTGSDVPRLGLTISFYRADNKTGDRTPIKQYETAPRSTVEASHVFPPCTCPRYR
ncbi:hypothetical protein ACFWEB_20295 [Streptomyces parvus]|uniref:hypothetical protein n=1 Tax=Streptomyces parvus TaxID=66428 RepID=UPI003667447F